MGVNGIYGLSGSGMDIESMVKVGMMSKQNEYDKMAQKFTKNEWLKADYLDLSSKITTFNSSTLSQYKMSNNMNAKSVESSNSAVKVSANSSAALMNHNVEVTSLSSNAYLVGTHKLERYNLDGDTTDNYQSSMKLKDVLFSSLRVRNDGSVSGVVAKVSDDLVVTATDPDTGKPTAYRDSADDKEFSSEFRFGRENYTKYYEGSNVDTSKTSRSWQTKDASGNWVNSSAPQHGTISGETDGDYSVDPNVWRLNESGNWEKNNGTSGSPDWQSAATDPTAADYNYLDTSKWRQYDTQERDITATTGDNSPVTKSQYAFEFQIYDGTETEALAKMTTEEKAAYKEAHTIRYTYDQLLGNDGEAKTFYDLVSDINKISGLNIKASYDAEHDTFSFYNSKGGEDNNINIVLDSDSGKTQSRSAMAARNFFNNMGLYQSANGKLTGETVNSTGASATVGDKNSLLLEVKSNVASGNNAYTGSNGEIVVDGVSYTDITDNKVTVGGITYTALNTTESTGAATVSVSQDTDAIIDKVKSFVSDYNKLLSSLYEKYDEKPNSDYKPLTQAQKDQMKEDQITKWEEKAKAGLLYHDQTLGKVIMNMRNAIAEPIEGVDGKYNSIFSLGVSTTGLKGQLVLDEDKLKKALAEDPDLVYNVFAKLDSNDLDNSSKSGVAQRLGDIFVDATKSIKDRAGSSSDITEDSDLNNLLRNLQTKMSNFKKLMNSFEDALYKKYDAMESTLAKLGTQLNYVMGSTGQ